MYLLKDVRVQGALTALLATVIAVQYGMDQAVATQIATGVVAFLVGLFQQQPTKPPVS